MKIVFSSSGTDTPCLHSSTLASAAVREHSPASCWTGVGVGWGSIFGFQFSSGFYPFSALLESPPGSGGISLPSTILFLPKFYLWISAPLYGGVQAIFSYATLSYSNQFVSSTHHCGNGERGCFGHREKRGGHPETFQQVTSKAGARLKHRSLHLWLCSFYQVILGLFQCFALP